MTTITIPTTDIDITLPTVDDLPDPAEEVYTDAGEAHLPQLEINLDPSDGTVWISTRHHTDTMRTVAETQGRRIVWRPAHWPTTDTLAELLVNMTPQIRRICAGYTTDLDRWHATVVGVYTDDARAAVAEIWDAIDDLMDHYTVVGTADHRDVFDPDVIADIADQLINAGTIDTDDVEAAVQEYVDRIGPWADWTDDPAVIDTYALYVDTVDRVTDRISDILDAIEEYLDALED